METAKYLIVSLKTHSITRKNTFEEVRSFMVGRKAAEWLIYELQDGSDFV